MRRGSMPGTAINALAAGAILVAACSSTASLLKAFEAASRLELLDGKLIDLDASLRLESSALAGRITNLESALGKSIAAEGRSSRAGTRREAALVEERLSRAIKGRDELLSGLSLKIDSLDRAPELSRLDTFVKEGRSESVLMRDIALARMLEEADRCFVSGRYSDAAERYAAVIEMIPGDARLRQRRAISLFRANPADSSVYDLVEGELRDSAAGESAESLEALALISVERRRWTKALEYFDRLIERRPEDAKILKEAGECALFANEGARALAYFDGACRADPNDAEAERGRARARAALPSGKAR
jgi:tetratricopeptide (TPR) repeat protein